jgi:hypothetical protein
MSLYDSRPFDVCEHYGVDDFIGVLDSFITQGEYLVCDRPSCAWSISVDDNSLSDTVSEAMEHWNRKHA